MKKIVLIGLSLVMILCLCSCGNAKDEKLSSISAQLVSKEFKSRYGMDKNGNVGEWTMSFEKDGKAKYENYSAGNGWLFFEETVYTYDVKMENGIYFIDLTVVECKNQYGEQSNNVKPGDKEKYYIELSGDSVTMIYNDDQKLRFE